MAAVVVALVSASLLMTGAEARTIPRLTVSVRVHVGRATVHGRLVAVVVSPTLRSTCAAVLVSAHESTAFPYERVILASAETRAHSRHSIRWTAPPAVTAGRWTAEVTCRTGERVKRASRTFKLTGRRSKPVVQGSPVGPSAGGFGGGTYPPFGQVVLHGSQWLDGHGVDVHSNGCNGCGSSQADWHLDGAYGYAWQCVELFERLINVEGWYHGTVSTAPSDGAKDLFPDAPASAFVKHPNGSGYIPVPGDAVVFAGETYGHVAIVNWVSGNHIGVVEQNAAAYGQEVLTLSGSSIAPVGPLTVEGVLHPRLDAYTNGSGAGGPGSGGPSGGPGFQMLLDGAGQVWAKNSIGNGGWTQETPAGEVAIAAGADGTQMLLDGAGQVWAKNSIGNGGWTQETPAGEKTIAAG